MSKADRQRSARQRLAEERDRQQVKERRQRAMLIGLGAIVVIAVVVVGVVVVRGAGDDGGGSKDYQGAMAPVARQPDGSVVLAKAGVTTPLLEIYEDFQCPGCKSFEETNNKTIKELAAAGQVRAVYRPFSLFKDFPEPTKGNSLRALNASLCAPADRWMPYHDRLFEEQGPETSKGFADDELIEWAADVGIKGGGFDECVTGMQQNAQVGQANAAAAKAGVQSTPWLTLNGKKLGQDATFTADGLRKAILGAAK